MEPLPDHFEVVAGRGFFRPTGKVSLDEAVELVNRAIAYARASGITKLIVSGAASPGLNHQTLASDTFLSRSGRTQPTGQFAWPWPSLRT